MATDTVAILTPPAFAPAHKMELSVEEEAVVYKDKQNETQVRALLPPGTSDTVDSADVCRFVRATGGNLPMAAKRLTATLRWREEHKPHECTCKACAKDPKSHYMHVIGHDALGRPIIYSCFAAAINKNYNDNHDHMIETFETAIRLMPPGIEQWVWVCDFHGFGVADLNPKLARAFLSVSADHYPERLGLFLIVDAPSLFGVLWRAISSFVDPKTYNKIRFLPADMKQPKSSLKACLDTFCTPDVTQWLATEMLENRDSKKVAAKAYSAVDLGQPVPEDESEDGHNLHGSRKLRQLYASSPNLLRHTNSDNSTTFSTAVTSVSSS